MKSNVSHWMDGLILTKSKNNTTTSFVRFIERQRQVRIQKGTELKGLVLNAFILLGDEPMRSYPRNEAGRIKLETCE